ncbi:(2Fe-2S)-binding protein [Janthinobacterium sp.]|uniref:(2Fe-2S)-binding protein n=1 Tax=Janthinobacterium sp. TaxID=1871054 RepID=UPI00263857E5|nr:(2Fe-2S)-binding protein [Janthinobacterium sp.]
MHNIIVNGQPLAADVDPQTPLLWVLREVAQLTGTKFGCGIGLCGACTVHVDGRAVRSCITPLASVEACAITTIEGLSPDGKHPLQQAWIAAQAPQCGYCQPGQIMQAATLLRDYPQPTDANIDAVMSGNLCRCMAYVRIRKAIKLAAASGQETPPHA